MILTATGYGLGTLWIANTCFAYNELMDFIGTDSQLTGIAPENKQFYFLDFYTLCWHAINITCENP